MHPAPSLIEAPPSRDESRQSQQRPLSADSAGTEQQRRTPSTPSSPPVRKNTASSTSTAATAMTVETGGETPYSTSESSSPRFASQAVFPVRDGPDLTNPRRPSRRRTGPLSASQREKAALIRKLGACNDCRRRRVACHPKHHNMSWEDAVRRYKNSPTREYAPIVGHTISPSHVPPAMFSPDPQEMDIDNKTTPTPATPHRAQVPQQRPLPVQMAPQSKPPPPSLPLPSSGRLSIGSDSRLRTPLPSGRNLEKLVSALPGIDSLSGDLQSATARIINSTNPYRSRYDVVHAMLLLWSTEPEIEVRNTVDELANVLEKKYGYVVEVHAIPASAQQSPYRWLLQTITQFVNTRDLRETLKIVYYAGCSYLDADREMVLSSSVNRTFAAPVIRWSGIQQVLEDARSDILILMDAAFYPCSNMTRQEGVLELISASAGEDPSKSLGRVAFTRTLIEELDTRLSQKFRGSLAALSASELHVRLMSKYPRLLHDRNPERELVTSRPSPLHIQISSNPRLPSILLAPSRKPLPSSPEVATPGTQLNLTIQLADGGGVDKAGWTEWMRLLPDSVREVKCESPFRNTFR